LAESEEFRNVMDGWMYEWMDGIPIGTGIPRNLWTLYMTTIIIETNERQMHHTNS